MRQAILKLTSWTTVILFLGMTIGFVGNTMGQSTGEIRGQLVDSETGETLIGAHVMIQGTQYGQSTDEDGYFHILQLSQGTYDLEITYLGYHRRNIVGVRVRPGLTTDLGEIELVPEAIEGEEVTIYAEEPMVRHDITSARSLRGRDEMQYSPGIESTEDFFRLEGGVVEAQAPERIELEEGQALEVRDESLQNLHVRGGRGGEIQFLIDGMPVNHPIYGGRSVLNMNVSDIDGIEMLTGGFSAEYGNAQSGVVSISTRGGTDTYTGGFTYKNDTHGLGDSRNRHFQTARIAGPEPITSELLPSMGINIPGRMRFYLSGSVTTSDGSRSFARYDDHGEAWNRPTYNLFGLELPGRHSNTAGLNFNLNYQISRDVRATMRYNAQWREWTSFSWAWVENPNNTPDYSRDNKNLNIQVTHTLSDRTFYNVRFGYLSVDYNASVNNMSPDQYWEIDEEAGTANRLYPQPTSDPLTGFAQGLRSIWRDDLTHSYTAKGDLTSQFHRDHQIKTGFEVSYHDLQYIDIQGGGHNLSPYGRYLYEEGPEAPLPPGPFPEFGNHRWVFDTTPLDGAAYVQNRYSRNNLILNFGIRGDWFYPGESVFDSRFKEVWEMATGLESDWDRFRYKFSPRLGISFPINPNTVMFFSYGHFYQLPELQFYYRDPYTGSLVGNPHLDYEQTVTYEFGFTHSFHPDWAVDIKAFNRDITNQVGTTRLLAALGLPVSLYDNKGNARARGIETELKNRLSNYTSMEISHTIQWATGFSSSAFDDYVRSITDMPNPIRERPTSWDVRNQILFRGSLISPRANPFQPFGIPIPGGWDLTVLSDFSSGRPFTPGTRDPVEQMRLENSLAGPIRLNTDINFRRMFNIGGVEAKFLIEIFNVFDQRNANISYAFNNWTGEPHKFGDTVRDTAELYVWNEMYRMLDPRQFQTGRRFQFGLEVNF